MDPRVEKVVILGGGTAGWMTAAALSKINAAGRFSIVLVESDEISTVGVGEATIPTIHWFNQIAGVDEAELFRATKATFKLGIAFRDWRGDGASYFHPFGRYGGPADQSMFYHRWIRQYLAGRLCDHEAFSLAAQLAKAGRFATPANDPRGLGATLGYAYHFDAGLYAAYLRHLAEARGVQRVEGRVRGVRQDGESGFVTALETDKDQVIEGDLFVDCSGFRALLIGETLGVDHEDWSAWLPCDRALAVPSTAADAPVPYTQATARTAGWQWRIPLQHRIGNGLVYCSAHLNDDAACAELLANVEQPLAAPRSIRFRTGIRQEAWNRNVVAIGLSSGFLEPLESTSIHFIQSGIAKLMSLFPTRVCRPVVAEQFNRVFRADMESARDMLILHYRATEGRTDPFWQAVRAQTAPDSLRFKIESFIETGRVVLDQADLFREASWFSVMMGQGITPRDYNPLTESISEDDDQHALTILRDAINTRAGSAEPHAAAITNFIR
jgi:tryptophan halogenase